ncbi:MAG: TIGR03546 family protein [Planctomycetota bacterium]
MLFLLKQLRALYKVLISETSPVSIASGFATGVILGLTPFLGLHTFLILCAVLMLRINLSAVFITMAVFKLLSIPLWEPFHGLGAALLSADSLRGLWTFCTNTGGLKLFKLNNSQMLGSLLVSLLLAPLVFGLGVVLVHRAREILTQDRQDHWLVKWVNTSRLLKLLAGWAS